MHIAERSGLRVMSYSQWNVLQDELEGEASSRFLGKLWHKTKQSGSLLLDIYLPVSVYVRGKAFCEDIEELSEMVFTQASLLNLLYNDWLLFAKRTNNLIALYNLLTSLESGEKGKKGAFYSEEGGTPRKRLHVQIKRRHLLRGELLLSDLEGKVPKHGYTIERVFELLYINFMKKHKDGGEVVQEILRLLED